MAGLKHLDSLRCIDSRVYYAERATQRWVAQGHRAYLGAPAADRTYLSFVAQSTHGVWQGAMATQDWLSFVLPQLRELLSGECSDTRIMHLFETVARPFEVSVSELQYDSISSVALVPGNGLQGLVLASLETPEGTLWLTGDLPVCQPVSTPLPAWASALPLPLRMIIGISHMPRDQLARLGCGDVLVIGERTQHLSMAERCVGRFDLTEEGFHMEFNSAELPLQTFAGDLQDAAPPVSTKALELLPIRLEFVLQEQVCTLADLTRIQTGEVLPLQPKVQDNVEIRANGERIAVGELVRWEGGLGVQLHTLVRDAGE